MIGGLAKVVQDIPPFVIADGQPARIMEQELNSSEEVEHLLRFLRNAERGICRGAKD